MCPSCRSRHSARHPSLRCADKANRLWNMLPDVVITDILAFLWTPNYQGELVKCFNQCSRRGTFLKLRVNFRNTYIYKSCLDEDFRIQRVLIHNTMHDILRGRNPELEMPMYEERFTENADQMSPNELDEYFCALDPFIKKNKNSGKGDMNVTFNVLPQETVFARRYESGIPVSVTLEFSTIERGMNEVGDTGVTHEFDDDSSIESMES